MGLFLSSQIVLKCVYTFLTIFTTLLRLVLVLVSFVTVFSRASLKMALRENGGQTLKKTSRSAKATLVHSDELVKLCDKLPKVPNRVGKLFLFIR